MPTSKEEKREYAKKYYEANREKVIERVKKHRSNSDVRERDRANSRLWYFFHKEERYEYDKKYRVENKEKLSEWQHKRRARLVGNGGVFTAEEWISLKEFYNFTCLRCGRREPEIKLEIDHVLPIFTGGLNVIANIQPLCVSCNRSKKTNHIDYRTEQP